MFSDSVGGIVFNARVVQLVGADHVVKYHGCPERVFVGRISEDKSGRAACVGAKGYGVKDGEYDVARAEHIVVSLRDDDGGVAFLIYVEHGDDV